VTGARARLLVMLVLLIMLVLVPVLVLVLLSSLRLPSRAAILGTLLCKHVRSKCKKYNQVRGTTGCAGYVGRS
jgi:hypothetical protein